MTALIAGDGNALCVFLDGRVENHLLEQFDLGDVLPGEPIFGLRIVQEANRQQIRATWVVGQFAIGLAGYDISSSIDESAAPTEVVIIDGVRTPIGRFGGGLSSVRPDDLLAHTYEALVERTGIDPATIEDVYAGCGNQAGEDNRNVARMSVLLAGFPVAFTLGGTALIFAAVGVVTGTFNEALLSGLPNRLFGIMSNETLVAVVLVELHDQ